MDPWILMTVLHLNVVLTKGTKVVDQFNNDPQMFVFLISTKAGGVGLNIVSANKVYTPLQPINLTHSVLFDPNWNPAHDLQAQDRAFRIGQRRDVEVFRLISQGTVEEIVYARQIYKQQQANIGYDASNERRYFKGVQGQSHGELFGLENIFSFDPDRPFLRGVVNKTSVAEQVIAMAELNFSQHERDNAMQLAEVDGVSGIRQFAKISSQNDILGKVQKEEVFVDPVTAILSEVGVEYTHLNMEIIGPSRVEARISEMAMSAAKDAERGDLRAYLSNHGVGGKQYKIGYKVLIFMLMTGIFHWMFGRDNLKAWQRCLDIHLLKHSA
jgi:DNA excision repair protein ERCC-6-like 2